MDAPYTGWILPEDVEMWLGTRPDYPHRDALALIQCVSSVNEFLSTLTWLFDTNDDEKLISEQGRLGGIMLAARLFRRRNSLGGIESLGDGGIAYIARQDSDIARLLGFDIPRVG